VALAHLVDDVTPLAVDAASTLAQLRDPISEAAKMGQRGWSDFTQKKRKKDCEEEKSLTYGSFEVPPVPERRSRPIRGAVRNNKR
jgi:hypothetical protein